MLLPTDGFNNGIKPFSEKRVDKTESSDFGSAEGYYVCRKHRYEDWGLHDCIEVLVDKVIQGHPSRIP